MGTPSWLFQTSVSLEYFCATFFFFKICFYKALRLKNVEYPGIKIIRVLKKEISREEMSSIFKDLIDELKNLSCQDILWKASFSLSVFLSLLSAVLVINVYVFVKLVHL